MRLAKYDTRLSAHVRNCSTEYGFFGFLGAVGTAASFCIIYTHELNNYGMPFLAWPLLAVSVIVSIVCGWMRYTQTFNAYNIKVISDGEDRGRSEVPPLGRVLDSYRQISEPRFKTLASELLTEIEQCGRALAKSAPDREEQQAMANRYGAMHDLLRIEQKRLADARRSMTTDTPAIQKIVRELEIHKELA